MSESRLFAVAFAALCLTGSSVLAQGSGPAEIPPASYAGNQYVDSRGCAFVRAGVSGNVVWIPRVGNDRRGLCGFRPTFAPQTAIAAAPEPAPAPAPVAAPIVAPPAAEVAAATPRPAAAAPRPAPAAPRAAAPIPTVASVTTPPRIAAAPAAPAAEPRRLTLAEACQGRSGPQASLIDSRTGAPVDCGPAAAPAAAAPAAQVASATPAAAPQVPGTGPHMTLTRVTRADICAEIAATGTVYIDRATGQPLDCSPVSGAVAGAAPTPAPIAAPTPVRMTVPATPVPGYRPAWDDGRINPDRGLTPAALVAPQAVAPGGRFVQVGTYREPANADRAAARLESMGYPVAFQSVRLGGVPMRAVAAGPFATQAEVNAALRAARSAGYGDAYVR